jgi:predicted RNase H-like nuclease
MSADSELKSCCSSVEKMTPDPFVLTKDIRRHLSDVPGATIDIIDAYACLWTARRIVNGAAVWLPKDEEFDAKGLRAEIVS